MSATQYATPDVSITVVQVIKGGEPDDDGVSLAGLRSPLKPTLNARHCACGCAPMPYSLWEALERYDVYSDHTDLWVRTLSPGDTTPLPDGASVIGTWTVSCSVS
ncbi:hypothetical protein GCM10009799_48850 [Nocardiopsis rhodophaea]|uniref:Uncharacterized protein n=1 Tax=Nocardiopsis rhodophaea TaxID=280238 RepID=A0ABN2TNG6_9ACTN